MSILVPEWRVDLVGAAEDRELFGDLPKAWTWISVPARCNGPLRELMWMQLFLRGIAGRRDWQVAFHPAGNRRLTWSLPCPAVGTVHDFSTFHVSKKYGFWRRVFILEVLPALIRRLDRVITISRASADDIELLAGVDRDSIDIISNGVSPRASIPPATARRRVTEALGIEPPWLLYVSRLEHPGKNHVRLIGAFESLLASNPDLPHRLVFAGADWSGSEVVHERISHSPQKHRINATGFVDQELLHCLLDGADALVFPSLYEGFGLPVLEAMASGVPVVCSDTSSLPEVAGDAAVYFDPSDEGSMAGAIGKLLSSTAQRALSVRLGTRRAAELTWEKAARATLRCLELAAVERS
ncbi:MAG: glycosyltransferase family 4 protein [Holophagales bacterium]|nr:glycosyltransferase family 4 protein [Holophagales bacterium]